MTIKRGMQEDESVQELCKAFLHLKTEQEMFNFLKDLCTPQEMQALSERWKVCKLLNQEDLSYRDINGITGASLTTIGRVARFLHDESYGGYKTVLRKMKL